MQWVLLSNLFGLELGLSVQFLPIARESIDVWIPVAVGAAAAAVIGTMALFLALKTSLVGDCRRRSSPGLTHTSTQTDPLHDDLPFDLPPPHVTVSQWGQCYHKRTCITLRQSVQLRHLAPCRVCCPLTATL